MSYQKDLRRKLVDRLEALAVDVADPATDLDSIVGRAEEIVNDMHDVACIEFEEMGS